MKSTSEKKIWGKKLIHQKVKNGKCNFFLDINIWVFLYMAVALNNVYVCSKCLKIIFFSSSTNVRNSQNRYVDMSVTHANFVTLILGLCAGQNMKFSYHTYVLCINLQYKFDWIFFGNIIKTKFNFENYNFSPKTAKKKYP